MSDPTAVSVILSTRNRGHYLREVLGTLAAQECGAPFEVVVIDNGSSDETPAILDDWCRRDARFRTAREERPGLSRGKNAGIRLAGAPLLLFTDDDVQVDPRWIETYRELFARCRDPLMIAGGSIVPIPHDLGRWPDWFDEAALPDVGMLPHREERPLRQGEYVWGANMAVPARLFDQVGGWNEAVGIQGNERVARQESKFFEDTELQDRVRQVGGNVWFCPRAVVHHRIERQYVTPRRITGTAFSRGRAEFWAEQVRVWGDARSAPRSNVVGSLLMLTAGLVRWGTWLSLFRVFRTKRAFERARRAAYASGQRLDGLLAGRRATRALEGAGRIALAVRSLLLRLTPDVP